MKIEERRCSLNSDDEQIAKTEDFATMGVTEDTNNIFAPEMLFSCQSNDRITIVQENFKPPEI